jgi:hypothetical protein
MRLLEPQQNHVSYFIGIFSVSDYSLIARHELSQRVTTGTAAE